MINISISTIDIATADNLTGDPVDRTNTDASLLADIGHDLTGWVVASVPYMTATGYYSGNHALQIVYNDDAGRGGIVYTGSGSSGHTEWTDASSIGDVLRRYILDDMSP